MRVSYLALEDLNQGDLFLYLSKTDCFDEECARYLFHQVINTIEYLHEQNIFHRDIKPENLIFDDNFTIKLVDFGFSTTQQISHSKIGTLEYMLPEVFNQEQYQSSSADLFAIAVLLFNILTKRPPFITATSSDQLYKLISTRNYEDFWKIHCKTMSDSDYFSDDYKSLMNSMLALDPLERLSISEIKESNWYNGKTPSNDEFKAEMQYRRDMITHLNKYKTDLTGTEAGD